MEELEQQLVAFGPVPSRRLGRSLGINNIPPKSCSYSCIYCQVGPTATREINRRTFFETEALVTAVTRKVNAAQEAGETIDYLTFVPDGEPTLDINLGNMIDTLRPLGIKIAIISNASLVWRDDVQLALNKADWVSLKVDTVDENIWRRINQPHPELTLEKILQGIREFTRNRRCELSTETMLVAGVNDRPALLAGIGPDKAYLAAPIRPPAQAHVSVPDEQTIVQGFEIFSSRLRNVQYLIGYEGDTFVSTGDPQQDLLAITAVHPMREEAVAQFLSKAGLDWGLIDKLITQGELKAVQFAGRRFYTRRIKKVP
jgi:wyosine [tRNA(Phe)-imidazoG37] synthetase (radical SAM superfamily)